MNYIGCFNRSRAANCLQPVFFRSWCASMLPGVECCSRCPLCAVPGTSMLPGVECYPCTLCAVPGASMLPGVECCSRCPFAPFLVSRCCQAWSVAAGAPLRRSWCLDAARRGVLPSCPLRPSLVPRCFQAWSVTRAPFAPVLVRPLRPLCYVIHIIVYHRF